MKLPMGPRAVFLVLFTAATTALIGLIGNPGLAGDTRLKFHPRVSAAWQQYLQLWNPMYFAVSEDGLWAGYVHCLESSAECSEREGRRQALGICSKFSEGSSPCVLFARAKTILWKGTVVHATEADLATDLPSAETLLENFEKIAFHFEFGDQDGRTPLIKWEDPIRISFHGEGTHRYAGAVESVAQELERATGHPLSIVDRTDAESSGGNLRVYFARSIYDAAGGRYKAEVARHMFNRVNMDETVAELKASESTCFGLITGTEDLLAVIARAVIFIPSNLSRDVTMACIVEELTQAMGLPNDSNDVHPSIFNDHSPFHELTAHDKVLLRLLYDNRLRSGMSWQPSRPIAKLILGELVGEGS